VLSHPTVRPVWRILRSEDSTADGSSFSTRTDQVMPELFQIIDDRR